MVEGEAAGAHLRPRATGGAMLHMFYFSGTGNARNVAHWVAQAFLARGREVEVVDLSRLTKGKVRIGSGDELGLASPTHGFDFPPITLSFLLALPRAPARNRAHVFNTRAGVRLLGLHLPGASGVAQLFAALVLLLKGTASPPCGPSTCPRTGSPSTLRCGRTPSASFTCGVKGSCGRARHACSTGGATCGRSWTCRRTSSSRRSRWATTSPAGSSSRGPSSPRGPAMAASASARWAGCGSSTCGHSGRSAIGGCRTHPMPILQTTTSSAMSASEPSSTSM
jgi:hypothetical protein